MTGGAGFIGSNLVEALSRDYKVYAIDNLHTGSTSNLKWVNKNVKFLKGDAKSIGKLVKDTPVAIFHLGFYSSSPMYRKNPYLVSEIISGMIAVLEFAKKTEAKVVFSSTSSIYNTLPTPNKEDMTPVVADYYTEGRYACERISELYNKLFGVDVAAMRFFSVYGWHEEAKAGYANLVSQFLWCFKQNKRPVIYGDGTQTRDFVFVSDVVDALIKASKRNEGYNVYNVGTGKNYSLNYVISKLQAYTGKKIKPKYVKLPEERRKNYITKQLADVSKAQRMLGFKAQVSVDQGIKMLLKGRKS